MKAIAYGTLCAFEAVVSLEATTPSVRNIGAIFAAVAFCAFISNVGRRPVR